MSNNILLYVPNVIGYLRVVLLAGFYLTALSQWKVALTCYLLSFAGDLLEGYFAKKLNQTSTFGMILDMVTDRIATTGLLSYLAVLYPHRAAVFASLQGLDLSSHWFHMYTTASAGGHHKSDDTLKRRNIILRTYYANYPLFAYLCVSAELTYVALYVLHWEPSCRSLTSFFWLFCLPGCLLKQIVNCAQLVSAVNDLVDRDQAILVDKSS